MLHNPARFGILFVALLLAAPAVRSETQAKTTLQEIKTSLICTCECGMTVEACEGAMTCTSSKKLAEEAQSLIDRGLDKKQVLASFVGKYGEQILSAPTKKGFNLAAWITPFAVILITGFIVVRVLRKWARLQPAAPPVAKSARKSSPADAKYEKLLDDVLKELD